MPRTNEICNAGNKSTCTATSIHETDLSSITFTGNPYQDLANFGITLHGCTIRYLRSPNTNGNTITGRFNIVGRIETAGATHYEELILFIIHKWHEHRAYYRDLHFRKERERQVRRHKTIVLFKK